MHSLHSGPADLPVLRHLGRECYSEPEAVYGERQHETIQRRRRDPEAMFGYLFEERIPACVNHLFSALTGERVLADLQLPLGRLPLIEALNGSQPEAHNERARLVGRRAGMSPVGGSDSHTLAGVARAYTEVAAARNKADFLAGSLRGTLIGGTVYVLLLT